MYIKIYDEWIYPLLPFIVPPYIGCVIKYIGNICNVYIDIYISISRIFFTRIKIIYIYITYGYIYVHIYAAYSRTVFQKFIQTIDDRLVYKNYHKYIYTDWNFPKYKNIRKFQMVFTFLELSQKKPFSYKKVVYRTRAVNN